MDKDRCKANLKPVIVKNNALTPKYNAMDKRKRNYWEAEVEQWIDAIGPIETSRAPEGFAARVMAAVKNDAQKRAFLPVNSRRFWQAMAAGVALLVGLNMYTLHSIKSVEQKDEAVGSYFLVDEQVPEADTYGNYSQLAYEKIND